jgi:hypothetical protein
MQERNVLNWLKNILQVTFLQIYVPGPSEKKIFGINFLQIYSMMKHTQKKRYDGKQIVQHRTSMSESKKTMFITQ